jgi:hypothetical protein
MEPEMIWTKNRQQMPGGGEQPGKESYSIIAAAPGFYFLDIVWENEKFVVPSRVAIIAWHARIPRLIPPHDRTGNAEAILADGRYGSIGESGGIHYAIEQPDGSAVHVLWHKSVAELLDSLKQERERRSPNHWFSVETPGVVFKEIKLPARESEWTKEHFKRFDELKELAERHGTYVQQSINQRG